MKVLKIRYAPNLSALNITNSIYSRRIPSSNVILYLAYSFDREKKNSIFVEKTGKWGKEIRNFRSKSDSYL